VADTIRTFQLAALNSVGLEGTDMDSGELARSIPQAFVQPSVGTVFRFAGRRGAREVC
jgi:hypothetical protein